MPADPSSRQLHAADERWHSDCASKNLQPTDPHESPTALEEIAESYVLERMTPDETDRYEEHLLVCSSCRQAVEAVDDFVMLFHQASEQNGQKPS